MCCDVTVLIVCDLTERSCLDRQHFKGLTWIGSSWLTEVFYNWKNERNKLKWINCYCLLHNTKVQREGKVQRLVTRHLETNQLCPIYSDFFFVLFTVQRHAAGFWPRRQQERYFIDSFSPCYSAESQVWSPLFLLLPPSHAKGLMASNTHTHTPSYIIDVYLWALYVSRYRIVSKCVMLSEVSVEN